MDICLRAVNFKYRDFFEDFTPYVKIIEILAFWLTLINISNSDTGIEILGVPLDSEDYFRIRWAILWIFNGVVLILAI